MACVLLACQNTMRCTRISLCCKGASLTPLILFFFFFSSRCVVAESLLRHRVSPSFIDFCVVLPYSILHFSFSPFLPASSFCNLSLLPAPGAFFVFSAVPVPPPPGVNIEEHIQIRQEEKRQRINRRHRLEEGRGTQLAQWHHFWKGLLVFLCWLYKPWGVIWPRTQESDWVGVEAYKHGEATNMPIPPLGFSNTQMLSWLGCCALVTAPCLCLHHFFKRTSACVCVNVVVKYYVFSPICEHCACMWKFLSPPGPLVFPGPIFMNQREQALARIRPLQALRHKRDKHKGTMVFTNSTGAETPIWLIFQSGCPAHTSSFTLLDISLYQIMWPDDRKSRKIMDTLYWLGKNSSPAGSFWHAFHLFHA